MLDDQMMADMGPESLDGQDPMLDEEGLPPTQGADEDMPFDPMRFGDDGEMSEVYLSEEQVEELQEEGSIGIEIDMDTPEGPQPVLINLILGEDPNLDVPTTEDSFLDSAAEDLDAEVQDPGMMVEDAAPTEVSPDGLL